MLTRVRRSLSRSFDYDGRSSRGEYFAYFLAAIVALLLGPFVVLIMIPGFAATVRRLHDLDYSGRWALLPVAPILLHVLVVPTGLASKALWPVTMAAIVLVPIGFAMWMSRPGTPGPNRFGDPDPGPLPPEPAVRTTG